MLLVRFATQAKFHLDSGGGGPESNLKLIPYLLQASLYVLNQTKQQSLYMELVDNYLGEFDAASSATDVKGPCFMATAALLTRDHVWWSANRIRILETLVVSRHLREKKDTFDALKPAFFFWFLIDKFFALMFIAKDVATIDAELETHSERLALYIRTAERDIIKRAESLIGDLQGEVYPCESLDEFRDVAGIIGDIGDDFVKCTLDKHLSQ